MVAQLVRLFFEHLEQQQLTAQFLFGIVAEIAEILFLRVELRQKALRLDVEQRRRHHQKVAGDVHVHRAYLIHIGEILPGDLRKTAGRDVELALLDQSVQKVERTFEIGQLELDDLACVIIEKVCHDRLFIPPISVKTV